jgi:hypothetical protein
MVRSLLGTPSLQSIVSASIAPSSRSASKLSAQQIEARLRQRRSQAYIDAVNKLDAGGYVHTRESLNALLATIENELHEVSVQFWPVGYVAKCHLGPPYEVHSLDISGNIICHFKVGQILPDGMERARSLAQHPQYAFIEVYSDKLIAVAANGDISLVKG